LEDVEVDGLIQLEYLGKIGWEFVGWIHLAQDGYQWEALVNTVINLQVP
jgi:hypothetical protein